MKRHRYVIVCAGITVTRPTLTEAKRCAYLQERRHGKPAEIYERTEHAEILRRQAT